MTRMLGLTCCLLVIVIIGCVVGCVDHLNFSGQRIVGSGIAASETRQVEPFTRIHVQSGVRLDVKIGEPQALTVAGDDNIVPVVRTDVQGNTLLITNEPNVSTSSKQPVVITITTPALDGLKVSGSCDGNISGLAGKSFEMEILGSGDVELDGKVDSLNVDIKGSGDVDTRKLDAANVNVRVAGSGDVQVNARETLSVQVSGSGDVRYVGNPRSIQKQINGSGSVKRM